MSLSPDDIILRNRSANTAICMSEKMTACELHNLEEFYREIEKERDFNIEEERGELNDISILYKCSTQNHRKQVENQ